MAHKSNSKTRRGLSGTSLFALAVATAFGAGGVANAQDAEEAAQEEEIVVTGFRASLAAAVDIKRNEVGAVDAIVAEDIADFPDANLSESIQRIPGVAITRGGGEGRQISVRGLGAQFTRVRINGMEGLSTVGATDAEGGANRNRSFDFNVFASELFNNITVRKSASANVEEGSLGATVDLRTSRPFDHDGFTLAITGQAGHNDLSGNTDPRAAFLISNTNADNTFGGLLSVAFSNRDAVEEGASTVRWQNNTNCIVTPANCFQSVVGNAAAVNAAFHPRIPRYDYYESTQERLGVTASLQWRPTDATDITLDALFSSLDATRMETFIQAPVFSTNGASAIGAVDVLGYEIQGNSLVYGLFNDVDLRSEMRFDELTTEFSQYTLHAQHQFTDQLSGSALIGRSESLHNNPVQTTLLWNATDSDGYSYDYRNNSNIPDFDFGSVNIASPAAWTLGEIRLRPITVDNSFETVKGDLEFGATNWLTLSGGANFNRYEFVTTEQRRWNGTNNANQENVIVGTNAAGSNPADYVRLITTNGLTWAVPNVQTAAGLWGLYDQSNFRTGIEPILGNNAAITEESAGAYAQLGWDTDIGSIPVRGNIGVRYVETDLSSVGYTYNAGTGDGILQTIGHSYNDTLPSLNIAVEPMEDFIVRFGASRVMSRPGLGNLNPGATVARSGNNKTVTAGNPFLDPFRADALDLAFEYYFQEEGLFSVAFFRKDVTSFVQTLRSTGVYTGNPLGLPDSLAIAACVGSPTPCSPADSDWQFAQPLNTPGGTVEGFEISMQLPFFFLPGALSNFGLLANYTNVSSSFDTYGNGPGPAFDIIVVEPGAELTNLSPESWNATLYYEDDRFSARVSGAYRSAYITTIPGRNGNASESTESTLNVDAAASYTFNDRMSFTLEALNLTDEVSSQILSPDNRSSFYHSYGTSVFAGFRYTY
ncbi:MAG: TonB-dependent receptor [Phycisphaerales bacterium]|nr:TonB-dependent receptor [Hyphomonadaceae bacterium]